MATLSFIGVINATLRPMYNRGFVPSVSDPQPHPEGRPLERDVDLSKCILKILQHASYFAYPEESRVEGPIRLVGDFYYRVVKTPYTSFENRVSSVFLERVRDFAHVYLHYLHQGWNIIPRDERLFRNTPHTDESVYMEKKQNSLIESGEAAILRYFAKKAGCEIFKISTYPTVGNYTLRLHGTKENVARLLSYIKKQAGNVTVKIPLPVIRASQIEGPVAIDRFLREKSGNFLKTSQSFLIA